MSARPETRGRCLVSEPFDRDGCDWHTVPPASFVTVRPEGMTIAPFAPASADVELDIAI